MLYPLEDILIFLHEGRQLFDPVLELRAIKGESGGRHLSRCQRPPLTPNTPPKQILFAPRPRRDDGPQSISSRTPIKAVLSPFSSSRSSKKRVEYRLTPPDQLTESVKSLGAVRKVRQRSKDPWLPVIRVSTDLLRRSERHDQPGWIAIPIATPDTLDVSDFLQILGLVWLSLRLIRWFLSRKPGQNRLHRLEVGRHSGAAGRNMARPVLR